MKKMNKIFIGCLVIVSAFVACTKDKTTPTTTTSTSTNSTCSDTIRYSVEVLDMINSSCISCHGSGGTSPDLSDYSKVSTHASAVYGSINSGSMPQGSSKLSDAIIQDMQCWISQGRLNN